jgi:hypothetical protein
LLLTAGVVKRSGKVETLLGFDPMLELRGLAADGEHVYWLTEDGCYARPPGGGPTVKLASPKMPTAFAIDSSHLYWADDQGGIDCLPYEGKIWSMPKAGGEPRQLAGRQIMVVALGVDATHAYWMTQAGVLRRAPKQGGKAETLARSGRVGFWPIAVGGGYVFWAWPAGRDDPNRVIYKLAVP